MDEAYHIYMCVCAITIKKNHLNIRSNITKEFSTAFYVK